MKKNILEEFKLEIMNTENSPVINDLNQEEIRKGYKSIPLSKFIDIPNLGFPLPDDYDPLEERTRWEESRKSWNKFLHKHPLESSDWRSSTKIMNKVRKLIRTIGIYSKYRPQIWMKLSGAFLRRERNRGYYHNLLSSHKHFPNQNNQQSKNTPKKKSGVEFEIDQDLKRTFPEHNYYGGNFGENGREKMRRVLLAYSWRNPLISYCQSFNYIVGMLLLHFEDEEDVFWILTQIIEEILPPNYFNKNLIGIRADSLLFNFLLKTYIPNLYRYLNHDSFGNDPAGLFVSGWFMSIYTTTFDSLKPNHTLRVWDCFFLEGPVALYRIALSFFKIYTTKFLTSQISRVFEQIRTLPKTKIKFSEFDMSSSSSSDNNNKISGGGGNSVLGINSGFDSFSSDDDSKDPNLISINHLIEQAFNKNNFKEVEEEVNYSRLNICRKKSSSSISSSLSSSSSSSSNYHLFSNSNYYITQLRNKYYRVVGSEIEKYEEKKRLKNKKKKEDEDMMILKEEQEEEQEEEQKEQEQDVSSSNKKITTSSSSSYGMELLKKKNEMLLKENLRLKKKIIDIRKKQLEMLLEQEKEMLTQNIFDD